MPVEERDHPNPAKPEPNRIGPRRTLRYKENKGQKLLPLACAQRASRQRAQRFAEEIKNFLVFPLFSSSAPSAVKYLVHFA